jgi:4-hydroxybenzoate polyprenyltransferase
MPRLLALCQLLRLSLAPTVVADLAAGVALAAGAPGAIRWLGLLAPISLLLFSGGMALNAWVDRAEDALNRPRRPLPSGAIPPGAALLIALLGLGGAPLLAAVLLPISGGAPALAAGIAVAIAAYHTPLRRNGFCGPLLLGLIRGGDLLLGAVAVAGLAVGFEAAVRFAACHAIYVIGASLVAHEEDREPRIGRARLGVALALAAVAVNALFGLELATGGSIVGAVALWQLFSLRNALLLFRAGAPGEVPLSAFAALLLSRLPLLPAAAAFAAGAGELGLLAIGMWWIVFLLVRIIPPT